METNGSCIDTEGALRGDMVIVIMYQETRQDKLWDGVYGCKYV